MVLSTTSRVSGVKQSPYLLNVKCRRVTRRRCIIMAAKISLRSIGSGFYPKRMCLGAPTLVKYRISCRGAA
jgi:hypothetical protein